MSESDEAKKFRFVNGAAGYRKRIAMVSGLLDLFPDALAYVSVVTRIGGEQHNPGQPLSWLRGKSMDQADALLRHLVERGTMDNDGVLHSGHVAWRALAILQLELEKSHKLGMPRGCTAWEPKKGEESNG